MQGQEKTSYYEYNKKQPFHPPEKHSDNLHLVFHHMTMDTTIIDFLNKLSPKLVSLNLVLFDIQNAESIFRKLIFDLPRLAHLRLNLGCLNFTNNNLTQLKKALSSLKQLETFHLAIPHANLTSLDELDDKFIDFSNVKRLGFNFFQAFKGEEVYLDLENLSKIINKCKPNLEKLTLNLSRNKLKNVSILQEALLNISDAKNMNLKLILYNCNLKQKDILLICDTLLKFDNLKHVKLDIRENYNVKKEYPSSKVISYCETLICAFRQMLAEGDDNELERKYRVFY